MKKMILAVLAAVSIPVHAEIYLSYCGDELSASFNNSNLSAMVSAATAFTPEQCAEFNNFNIQSIDFGIYDVSKLKTLKLWVRHHLYDTTNLLEWELEASSLASGWNRVELDSALSLNNLTDTLYIGYDYTQSAKSAKIVACSGPKKVTNSIYRAVNNKNWKEVSSDYGPLALRGVLIGSQPYDVSLLDLTTSNRTQFVGEGEAIQPLRVHGVIENHGYETLSNIVVAWSFDNDGEGSVTLNGPLPPSERLEFDLDCLPTTTTQDNNILAVTLSLPDREDACPANNSRHLYYEVVSLEYRAFPRQSVLFEQYTSLYNGFAPEGLEHCRQAIASLQEDPALGNVEIIPVVLHNGYGPADPLRVTTGNPYNAEAIFGEGGLQYAPAVCVGHRATMSSTLSVDSIVKVVKKTYEEDPHVFTVIEAESHFDTALGCYVVNAAFTANSVAWCDEPMVVACLVEDSDPVGDLQKDYYDFSHNEENVVVQYLTPSNGEPLTARLTAKQKEDIQTGRAPRNVETHNLSWNFYLPEADRPESYHFVIYVCEMTATSQKVDAVIRVKVEE